MNPSKDGDLTPFLFINQVSELGNACGTIATLHCLLNCRTGDQQQLPLTSGSLLSQIAGELKSLHPVARGERLAQHNQLRQLHHRLALQGQTAPPDDPSEEVSHHFVAIVQHFVVKAGDEKRREFIVLDGLEPAPRVIQSRSSSNGSSSSSSSSTSDVTTETKTDLPTSATVTAAATAVSTTSHHSVSAAASWTFPSSSSILAAAAEYIRSSIPAAEGAGAAADAGSVSVMALVRSTTVL